MARLLHRLGAGVYRHRLVVIAGWLLLLVLGGVGAATLSGKTTNSFDIPGQESTTALHLIQARFGAGASGATAQVVFEVPAGQDAAKGNAAAQISTTVTRLSQLPGVAGATNPLDPKAPSISRDHRAALSTVTYRAQAPDITTAQRNALLRTVSGAGTSGMHVEVSGQASQPTGADLGGSGELIGVVVALLVLTLTYGALVAAGMNLLTAVVGVAIGTLGITTLSGFVTLNSTTPILALMLGLAVGIDYALFIISRFRQELLRGREVDQAVAMAVGTAGSAVLTAGITVVIALAGLSVSGIPFLRQMGLAAAATIVVAVLVALTLVPAALGVVGRRALSRRQRSAGAGRHPAHAAQPGPATGVYARLGELLLRRRRAAVAAAVVALAVVAIPVAAMQTTLVQPDQAGTTQARAATIIDQHFGPGFAGPLIVLVDGPGAAQRAAVVRTQAARLGGVAAVTPPQPNRAGTAALLTVVPSAAPSSKATVDLVHALRRSFHTASGPQTYVTGNTAVSVDTSAQLGHALPIYLVLIVGLALVLLILVFRSILVPVVGVLGFLLTIGASLGATTAVFQWGWLKDVIGVSTTAPLLSLAPIIVIGILFGLAMDYQVFLVSRIHEAHGNGADAREAVRAGFGNAAPVVLAAASIMFAVFAGFVPGDNVTIKPIAFALAAGVLFDAVVVRLVAMPAALAILGDAAWALPRWLRWLPDLDVEGSALSVPEPTVRAPEPV